MKKLFYTIVTIFYLTIIINPTNVFAKKIQVADIPNNTYVIGTHMFTEDMLLTTSHIMLGATTIESDKLEDMIIYYKTPRGIWIDGLTGNKVTLPAELEITHKNIKKYEEALLYGDVDQNGKIESNDILLIMQYVEGTVELTDEQKKLADVDNDGVVDSADAQVLSCYYVDGLKTDPNGYNITLPYIGHTKYKISMDLDGGKGSILNSYYNISLLTLQSPTKEGYVFIGWTGSNGTTPELEVKIPEGTTGDLTYKANWALLGDVNQDGEITGKDVLLIMQYVEETVELTDEQKKLADVDNDGVIDSADVQILSCYIVDGLKTDPNGYNITIPYTGHTKYKISMDLDGGKGSILNSYYNISLLTLQSPKKEGYVFIGWTGSNGDTPELEVKISSKTTGDLTYKANWVLLGDVNQDGEITAKDVLLIMQYVEGKDELTNIQKKLADVDDDGVIDSADVQILSCYIVDGVKTDPDGYNITLPYTGHTKYKISMDLDGGQGTTINSYYNISTLTLQSPKKEDYVFIGWTGSNGATPELEVKISSKTTGNLTYKANWALLGDADQNGKIESKDALLIIQYVDGLTKLTDIQKKLADVDNDGTVDSADVQILSCYIVDGVKTDPEGYNITLPYTGHTKYQISTDLDGGQGSIINSYYNISEVTLKTPTKDGYVFIGWTGSNGDTPELEVKIPIGTTGDLTYKANWTKEN